MIKYEVRFRCYQHNSGRADNGTVSCKESFVSLEAAQAFYDKVVKVSKSKGQTGNFASRYVWSGYLIGTDGIYKITEEKIL